MAAAKIFISYRRKDAIGHAGRLSADLKREGFDVFTDIHDMPIGADFVEIIRASVAQADAVLAIIGDDWLTVMNDDGTRRLDHPNDYVRIEIASALARGITVIPVLIENAKMPSMEDLPSDIALLARRHAAEITDSRWEYDTGRLFKRLSALGEEDDDEVARKLDEEEAKRRTEEERRGKRRRILKIGTGVVALVSALILIAIVIPRSQISVPAVTGLLQAQAEATLRTAGFVVSVESAESASIPEGAAIGTDPARGERVAEGGTISLIISSGVAIIEVPSVRGLRSVEATQRLLQEGFKVKEERAAHRTIPAGEVISTRPKAGAEVERGSTVTLVISTGIAVVDLELTLTAPSDTAVGRTITVTLSVRNHPVNAARTRATDVKVRLEWPDFPATALASSRCTPEAHAVVCSFGNVDAAERERIETQITIDGPGDGSLDIQGIVSSAERDEGDRENRAAVSIVVLGS